MVTPECGASGRTARASDRGATRGRSAGTAIRRVSGSALAWARSEAGQAGFDRRAREAGRRGRRPWAQSDLRLRGVAPDVRSGARLWPGRPAGLDPFAARAGFRRSVRSTGAVGRGSARQAGEWHRASQRRRGRWSMAPGRRGPPVRRRPAAMRATSSGHRRGGGPPPRRLLRRPRRCASGLGKRRKDRWCRARVAPEPSSARVRQPSRSGRGRSGCRPSTSTVMPAAGGGLEAAGAWPARRRQAGVLEQHLPARRDGLRGHAPPRPAPRRVRHLRGVLPGRRSGAEWRVSSMQLEATGRWARRLTRRSSSSLVRRAGAPALEGSPPACPATGSTPQHLDGARVGVRRRPSVVGERIAIDEGEEQ